MPGIAIETDEVESAEAAEITERRFASIAILCLSFALLASAAMLLWLAGVSGDHFSPVLAGYMMVSLWSALAIALFFQMTAMLRHRRLRLDMRAPWLLVATLLAGTTLPVFEVFKQRILPVRGFPLDPALAAFDRLMFFGHDGWEVTHALFGSLWMTLLLDRLYALWIPLMFIFPAVTVMIIADIRQRVRILATWLASWILIAGVGAWLFASAGPVYYGALVGPDTGFAAFNAHFAALAGEAREKGFALVNFDLQALLLRGWYLGVQSNAAAGGISAMPSMHVAMASLFAMAGFAHSKALGRFFTVYALLIWIGSVHLGWHYASDGIVGTAMMAGLWIATGRLIFADKTPLPTR
jgi:PAP2 superfamily